MPHILTFRASNGDHVVVVNDSGETPIFADFCESLQLAYKARIHNPSPMEVGELQIALLESPRKYGLLMTFEVASQESRNARGWKARRHKGEIFQ